MPISDKEEKKLLKKIDDRAVTGVWAKLDRFFVIFFYILLTISIIVVAATIYYYIPGMAAANWGDDTVLVMGERKMGEGHVMVKEREIYIKLESLQINVDPYLFWDENEKTAIITTADKVVHIGSEALDTEVNLEPVSLEFPVIEEEGSYYLPLIFLSDFYKLAVNYIRSTDTVIVDFIEEGDAEVATVTVEYLCLRERPDMRSPVLKITGKGERVRLEESSEDEEWARVRSQEGYVGYILRQYLHLEDEYYNDRYSLPEQEDVPSEKKIPEHPFVLVWEYVHRRTADTADIGYMPSLNVVSPTWFHLRDSEGNLRNIADPGYVDWAKERGYEVWGLVTNDFDPEMTAEFLSSSAARKNMIDQLLIFANLYDLDGINLDFENFHSDYRDLYTQFARELAPLCKEAGLVLSVDVTFISTSTYWSLCYDRRALGEIVDYMMVMAYDEHWGSSPVAGSVSSLPWVERNLQRVLQEVPAEKVVLGVPFYTRRWKIEYPEDGGEKVSSSAYGMQTIEDILSEKDVTREWDEDALQNKVTYREDFTTYMVWMEDEDSMRRRIDIVNRYKLAGVAAWRRGFEKPEIWDVIRDELENYPVN